MSKAEAVVEEGGVAPAWRVLEPDGRDPAGQARDRELDDAGRVGSVELQWAGQVEGQRHGGQQVAEQPFLIDRGPGLTVAVVPLGEAVDGLVKEVAPRGCPVGAQATAELAGHSLAGGVGPHG